MSVGRPGCLTDVSTYRVTKASIELLQVILNDAYVDQLPIEDDQTCR